MSALDELNPFAISSSREGDVLVIAIAGELDLSTAPEFESHLESEASGAETVCVDLEGCRFVDSTGLQTLLVAAKRVRGEERRFLVRGLDGDVARMFEVTGLLSERSPIELADPR